MKPYDELPRWCQLLDPWFGPPWYAEIEDFDAWLAEVRQHLAGRVDELTDELAGDEMPGEGCLAKAGRLTVARHRAEEITRHEYGPLTPEDEDEDEPTAAWERPAWPTVAFFGAADMVLELVHRSRKHHREARPATAPAVPADVQQAVRAAYAASVQAGTPLSQRAMAAWFALSRRKIRQLVPECIVSSNGEGEAA